MKTTARVLLAFGLCASARGFSQYTPDDEPATCKIAYPYDAWLPQEPEDPAGRIAIPSLSQPFYNNVIDVRATVSASGTELIVSTAGNWQFALTKLLNDKYFVENPSVKESYLITTSPPISVPQLNTGRVKVGNVMFEDAQPHVAIAPPPLFCGPPPFDPATCPLIGPLAPFVAGGFKPFPFYQTYGNVILKLKDSTLVNSFADLAKIQPGRFASATYGAVGNYRNSVRNIFDNNPALVADLVAEGEITTGSELEAWLFDTPETLAGVAAIGYPMHQSIPHVIATGQADAGLFFLGLAVGVMRNNPGVFEAIYLSQDHPMGTKTTDPEELKAGQTPLAGNQVVTMWATKTTTASTSPAAVDAFIDALKSPELTAILAETGLKRPPGF